LVSLMHGMCERVTGAYSRLAHACTEWMKQQQQLEATVIVSLWPGRRLDFLFAALCLFS
jgi:hypothetical protein